MLAIHGSAGASDLWEQVIDASPGVRFALPDLPGFGRTPFYGASFDDLVDDLRAVTRVASPEPPWLLGFSFGAWLALAWAARHPREVAGVVAVGSPLRADPALDGPFRATMAQVRSDGRVDPAVVDPFLDLWFSRSWRDAHPEAVEAVRDQLVFGSVQAAIQLLQWHLDGPDVRQAAANLEVPATALIADDERIVDVAALREAFGERVSVVPDCGHMVPLERPEAVASVLAAVLSTRSRVQGRSRAR